MENLGKILKQNRNKKFLTIEEVSSITKIKEPYIVALEENEIENLPARVYSVGFLKNLADLYDLSQVDLIVAYDELKNSGKKEISKSFPGLSGKSADIDSVSEIKNDINTKNNDIYNVLEAQDDDYSFDKIKKLSIDEGENYEDSLNIIDDYIVKSQSELKYIALEEFKNKEISLSDNENTYPTSKIMLEFEELMREEERFNTQKLRKQETQRNINLSKDRMKNKRPLNLDVNKKGGGNIMILILLGIAIIVLLYIIITAILNR